MYGVYNVVGVPNGVRRAVATGVPNGVRRAVDTSVPNGVRRVQSPDCTAGVQCTAGSTVDGVRQVYERCMAGV